jgi:membrane-associated PAP2 superfamily phosphatase
MNLSAQTELSSPRKELLILAVVAAIATSVFWFSDLDLQAAGLFYHPENPDSLWPQSDFWLWSFFYQGVPVLAAILVLGSLFILIYSSLRGKLVQYKLAAGCVLLTILLGPGLLVNAIFKDHWCRPRPNQIIEFGGHMQHIPPLMIGESRKGESFPAGHPSVGFSLAIFWLLLRGRKPRLAITMLVTALTAGALMGIGRMAAGGHFLSDVLWSGFFSVFAAYMVFYYILRVPQRRAAAQHEDSTHLTKTPAWQIASYIVVGVGVLVGSLFGFPVDENLHYKVSSKEMPIAPQVVTLNIDKASVEIQLDDVKTNTNTNTTNKIKAPLAWLDIHSTIRGFGLPTNKVQTSAEQVTEPMAQITYQLKHEGIYSELNSVVKVKLVANNLERLIVRVGQGDITVQQSNDLNPLPQLDLTTAQGQVFKPAGNP